jgi:hypothetical protein
VYGGKFVAFFFFLDFGESYGDNLHPNPLASGNSGIVKIDPEPGTGRYPPVCRMSAIKNDNPLIQMRTATADK